MTIEPAVAVHLEELDPRLAEVSLRIACDVTNPLLGPRGAAAVYGPQKGASPADVRELDGALGRWADALEAATGRRERDTPGAGAAGGATFGLACLRDRFAGFAIVPGVELVMDAAGFAASLAGADLVLTGEGRIDGQTAFGKTALGVAQRAAAAGVGCIAVGGGVEPDGIAALAAVGAITVPVSERPQSVEEAMAAGTAPLERCGERLARLVGIGQGLSNSGRDIPSGAPARAPTMRRPAQILANAPPAITIREARTLRGDPEAAQSGAAGDSLACASLAQQ